MQEMVYTSFWGRKVLCNGVYKDHKFTILSLGTHPTAYVECGLSGCVDYDDARLDSMNVHGGFTYFGTANWPDEDQQTQYAGWDYAHGCDYSGSYALLGVGSGEKRWTTAEIFEEVKSVVEQMIAAEADDESDDSNK